MRRRNRGGEGINPWFSLSGKKMLIFNSPRWLWWVTTVQFCGGIRQISLTYPCYSFTSRAVHLLCILTKSQTNPKSSVLLSTSGNLRENNKYSDQIVCGLPFRGLAVLWFLLWVIFLIDPFLPCFFFKMYVQFSVTCSYEYFVAIKPLNCFNLKMFACITKAIEG